jgi:TM2 domain-containing membrane protein YozV
MDDSPSLSLGLTQPRSSPSPTFAPQPVPKSPAIAFLLSLVVPGAGQIYCGKTSRGVWTLAIFFQGLAATIYLTAQLGHPEGQSLASLWGIIFRVTLFLYIFGFLDAFFTAREMTAGTDAFIAESPRVAAILNLLTRGFGYFYLGKRKLGFLIFIALGVFQSSIMQIMNTDESSSGGGLFLELVQIGLAADAYRIAREREKQILATIQLSSQVSAGLPAAIPVALGLLLVAGYFAVAGGFFLPNYASIDQSTARVTHNEQGTIYENPAYGVSLTVPSSWTIEQERPYLVVAMRRDRACSADLRPFAWSFLLGLDSYKRQLDYQLSQGKGLTGKILDERTVVLSELPGRDIRLSVRQERTSLVEHRIIARKGMTLYVLATYELAADGAISADPSCSTDLQFIRDNLRLPH